MYLWAGALTFVAVTIYVYYSYDSSPYFRASGPFEGVARSEPASLGGYYLITLAMLMGFIMYNNSNLMRLLAAALFAAAIPPFVFTQSRASYFAFLPLMGSFFILGRSWKLFFIGVIAIAVLVPSIIYSPLGGIIKRRVLYTFTTYPSSTGGIRLEQSAGARVNNWIIAFKDWLPKHMLFGHGVTGVGVVDAQYPRVIGETGLLGLGSFLWLLVHVWRKAYRVFIHAETTKAKAISAGFLAGYTGILVQSITTNTFIIIRVMEPFWVLTAMVFLLPKIYPPEKHAST